MPDADLPTKAYSMKQSPDGSMYWISGLEGEIKKVALCTRAVYMYVDFCYCCSSCE